MYGVYLNVWAFFAPTRAGKSALGVFSKVRAGRLRPRQKQVLESARDRVENIEGFPIQVYRWAGDGPGVLLAHGWQSNSARWKHLIPHLQQEGFDIYAFDAPGHGGSGGNYLHVPLYATVIRQLRSLLGTEYQIGHSMGGMAILYDLFEQPSADVNKIVTLGAPTHFAYILDQYEKALGLRSHVRTSLEAGVRDMVGRSVYDFNSIEFARGLKIPGLLLHDLEDPTIPYTDAVELEQHWDSSKLMLTRGYGHSLHHREVHECIADFLCERPLRIRSADPSDYTN